MSLWYCPEHGLYGGQVFCPMCNKNGSYVTIAFSEPVGEYEDFTERWNELRRKVMAHEVFQSENDEQFYFHVKSANGQIVAQSEGYTRAADAERGYHALLDAVHADVLQHLRQGTIVESEASRTKATEYASPSERDLTDSIRKLLKMMLTGWMLHEKPWHAGLETHERDNIECMIEAAGGDELLGNLLHVFSHWSNDIEDMAARYGIGFERVKPEDAGDFVGDTILRVRDDIPPAPSPEHYWDKGAWHEPHGLQPGDTVEV